MVINQRKEPSHARHLHRPPGRGHFDTDGVLTDTASVHAAAWKRLFDEYLEGRAARLGEPFRSFTVDDLRHVDGRPRYDGVAAFLASRGITLPWGDQADPPGRETVRGLGNAKDRLFVAHLRRHGARAFDGSADLVRRLRAAGTRTAVVSASRNMLAVLAWAGLSGLFDADVDGVQAWPASPTRPCSLRRPAGSGCRPGGPRWSRTPSPGWRPAAVAGSGWWSGWTGPARPPPWPSGAPMWSWPAWAS
jgi:beta-phosphoglucomutase-like phosphatase (HAD superfamily)